MDRGRAVARGCAAALAVALALACGGGDEAPAERSPAPPSAPAASAATPTPADSASRAGAPAGAWQLAYANGVLSLDATQAPRRAVLAELARRADFSLDAPSGEMAPLTLSLAGETLEAALPLLVGARSYEAQWETRDGIHALAKLVIGEPLADPVDGVSLRPGEVSDSLQRALAELRDEENPLSQEEALRRLDDADPATRLRAVLAVDGEDEEALPALARVIEQDTDPRVRAAATVALEESEEFAAVQALVGALDDPNPEVVVEVIDSLEFAGDASVVASLRPLLSHGDARVRKAAADAIRLLE